MIKSIFIEHFRSCDNLNIKNIKNVLVVVGKNGAGKTNIFRAIEWVASCVRKLSFQNLYYDPPVKVKISVEINGIELNYSIRCSTHEVQGDAPEELLSQTFAEEELFYYENGRKVDVFTRVGDEVFLGENRLRLKIGFEAAACPAILTTQPIDQTTQVVLDLYAFMRGVSYNHLDTLASEESRRVVFEKDYLKWSKNTSLTSDSFDTEMQLLDLYIRRSDKFTELKSILCDLGIISNLDIAALPTGDSNNPKIYFFHWYPSFDSDESYSWTDLSYGTRRLVKLFVALFYKDDKVFMIEQPEDGIHAGLLHQILPFLRAYSVDKQIFIATHSPQVLNRAEPNEVRLVYKENGSTHARELDEFEIDAATSFINEEGSLFDFLSMIDS